MTAAVHPETIWSVRAASSADFPAMREVLSAAWWATYEPVFGERVVGDMVDALGSHDLAGLLPHKSDIALVIEGEPGIVGTVIYRERPPLAYLWGMYVHPSFQRLGLGSQLIERVCADVVGCRRLELHVLKTSTHAYRFYRKLGFRDLRFSFVDMIPACRAETIVMSRDLKGDVA
ncbi:GNAT family N-acetyltransferase [Methylovirgula sp. 4M-Z18]|uniref:GNAT family N-acetyltransferase n=1 Tax=Methylovirgula sp. 4M-Z18 TaxID=2293567 RepID=UPI000E2E5CF9|nr:GNAT family N-acetyltransferase [Methylovirgula sp. 4M-Z18]RFB81059.1 GNAT family N-acetyltransferase [Methylovirgula sp. 4M-Z18]